MSDEKNETPEYLQATIIAVENGYLVCTNDKQYVFGSLGQATAQVLQYLGQSLRAEEWNQVEQDINNRILYERNEQVIKEINSRTETSKESK